jgi:hypothetical protein
MLPSSIRRRYQCIEQSRTSGQQPGPRAAETAPCAGLYRHLDATQLVKHAYGLVTEGRRIGRKPMLFYLFAEPMARGDQTIAADDHKRHRDEITNFAARVAGDEVSFGSASYREWLRGAVGSAANHAAALIARFNP